MLCYLRIWEIIQHCISVYKAEISSQVHQEVMVISWVREVLYGCLFTVISNLNNVAYMSYQYQFLQAQIGSSNGVAIVRNLKAGDNFRFEPKS